MVSKADKILTFCKSWKTSSEIQEEFEMSNTETYHILRWLRKGNYVEYCKAGVVSMNRNVDNRKFYYKTKK